MCSFASTACSLNWLAACHWGSHPAGSICSRTVKRAGTPCWDLTDGCSEPAAGTGILTPEAPSAF